MLKEFKEFAIKGNMVDLAVAVIIGAAFGAIVTSLVQDIIMPPIGMLTGGIDFSNMMVVLKQGNPPGPYADLAAAHSAKAVTLSYGNFINVVITFLIVAFSVFLVVKMINRLKREEAAVPAPDPAPTKDQVLLTEIRDLLAKK